MNDVKNYMKNSVNKLIEYTSEIEKLCESTPDSILIFNSNFIKDKDDEMCSEKDLLFTTNYGADIPIEGEIEILVNKMKKIIDEAGATYFSYVFADKVGSFSYAISKNNKIE
jgi:hypothetical protein